MAQRNPAGGYRGHPEALALARAARNHAELLRALLDPADRPALARLGALSAALGELRRLLADERSAPPPMPGLPPCPGCGRAGVELAATERAPEQPVCFYCYAEAAP